MLPALKKFLESDNDGTFFVGHASVLARIDHKLIMIDFVRNINFFLDSWFFFPKLEWSNDLIKKLDYVFISHSHDDHFDPILLEKLPKNIKIFFPDKRIGFSKFLNKNKSRVTLVPAFKEFKIDNTISVMAIPSDHNKIDSSYLIKGSNFSVYHGNDNFLTPSIVGKAVQKMGGANHAYIPFAYVWWYPFCLTSITSKRRMSEGKRLALKNMKIGAEISNYLNPEVIVPFAANMVYYDPKSVINKETANTFDFSSFCRKNYPNLYKKVLNLFPGDYVIRNYSGNTIESKNLSRHAYFLKLKGFLNKRTKLFNKEHRNFIFNEKNKYLTNYRKKLNRLKKVKLDREIYITVKNNRSKFMKIDSIKKNISFHNHVRKKNNSYIFYFEPKPLLSWLKGNVSFEDILNSQRFTVERYPEEFRPKIWDYVRENL